MMAASGVLRVPFMELQPNWWEVSRDPKAKFWVSCHRPGDRTLHGDLQKSDVGAVASSCGHGDGEFVVKGSGKCSITVECPAAQCNTTFVRPVRSMLLHDRKLLCMDVSASGALGVCSGEEGVLWVWDADTGDTRRSLSGHVGDVYTCRFFPSGIVVLSAGADLRMKIWSAENGSCPRTLTGHSRGISDTAIIDRGRNIISVSTDGTARLWDCGSGKCLATLASTECPINSCALAPSSLVGEQTTSPPAEPECGTSDKMLLLACENGSLLGCDVRNRKTIFSCSGGGPSVESCTFTSENTAVCGTSDGLITLLDLRKTDLPLQKISFGGSSVNCLSTIGDSRCLAACADGSCAVWSVQDPRVNLHRLTGPELDSITSVKSVAGSIYTSCRDGCVRVYQTADINVT